MTGATMVIAGATGLVGRHILAEFAARGEPVTALARTEQAAAILTRLGAIYDRSAFATGQPTDATGVVAAERPLSPAASGYYDPCATFAGPSQRTLLHKWRTQQTGLGFVDPSFTTRGISAACPPAQRRAPVFTSLIGRLSRVAWL